jgi:hypothetical protein
MAFIAPSALAAVGALGPFLTDLTVGLPIYTGIERYSIGALLVAVGWALPAKGVRDGANSLRPGSLPGSGDRVFLPYLSAFSPGSEADPENRARG